MLDGRIFSFRLSIIYPQKYVYKGEIEGNFWIRNAAFVQSEDDASVLSGERMRRNGKFCAKFPHVLRISIFATTTHAKAALLLVITLDLRAIIKPLGGAFVKTRFL